MDKRAIQTLEFDKILQQLSAHAESELGRHQIERLLPTDDAALAEVWQEETADAIQLILRFGNPPLFGITRLKDLTHRAKLGGTLSAGQLLQISECLRVSRALQAYAAESEANRLTDVIRGLFVQRGLEEEIANAILSPEEIADTASHTLFGLRRSRKAKQEQIKSKLNVILQSAAQAGHLRENLITVREGRYVLPVKAESRRSIHGVVHDQSASGATVFVEPMAVVELNNDIRRLEAEEREEIQRILAELSHEVAEFADEISGDQDGLQHLDFCFAKAKYALLLRASRPVFTSDRTVELHQARHPLLLGRVVPIDIQLGGAFNTLIITGPNTGGKTVTLKTLGLLTMMAQAGLQIPAKAPSKVGIFSDIYADIGDKQSIEMSLSTFSASMTQIVLILDKADENSLVLFDELGAGTDPTEGAALAMAILERLTTYDIRTVATTHYSELKFFAIRAPRVQNASVEFDVETLSPTYRLLIGLPGRSNAFEISRRLGLPEAVLEDAQRHLDGGSVRFEDVLRDIESNRIAVERERAEAQRLREQYNARMEELDRAIDEAKIEMVRRMEQSKERARKIVAEAEKTASSMLREAKQAQNGDVRRLDRTLNEIRTAARARDKEWAPAQRRPKKNEIPDTLVLGETVELVRMGQKGVVVSLPNKNGDLQIQMGILKVNANLKDVVRTEPEVELSRAPQERSLLHEKKSMSLPSEIDLRGESLDSAIALVDKYLDDAVLVGLPEVRLIHGKGSGVLRQGLMKFLDRDRRVEKHALADLKEGGAGVTVVRFR